MTDLTLVEGAIIRQLVEDNAPNIFGGPLHIGMDDTARYLAEGHIMRALPHLTLKEAWRAAANVLASEPTLVHEAPVTDQELALRDAKRLRAAEELIDRAGVEMKAGRYEEALGLVDLAEMVAPLLRPNGRTYDRYRSIINERSAK